MKSIVSFAVSAVLSAAASAGITTFVVPPSTSDDEPTGGLASILVRNWSRLKKKAIASCNAYNSAKPAWS